MTSFRDRFKDYQLQWLAWMIILLATLAISLFFGVNYPVPDQPDQPPEPVELGTTHFSELEVAGTLTVNDQADLNAGMTVDGGLTDIGGATYAIADGDNDVGVAGTLEVHGQSRLEGNVDINDAIDLDGDSDEVQLTVTGYTTQTSNLAVFEQSDGTDVVAIDNSGNVTLANGATIYGSTHTTGTHGMIMVCSGSHDHSEAENVVRFCTIPANANVIDYGYLVTTQWNDTSGATVNCGYEGQSTDVDAFLASYNVNGATAGTYVRMGAAAESPATTAVGDIGNQEATIRCQVAETDNDADAGAATFYLWYQLD